MKLKLLTLTSLFLLNTAWIQAQTTTSVPATAGNAGTNNSSFGDQAGEAGNNNSVFGYKAGDKVTGAGEYNSFFGANTGVFNTVGKDNVFVGYKSGYTNSSGEKNVFIGRESGYANSGGSMNVFNGYESGHNNFDGFRNTFSGAQSGFNNTSGSYNVFSGYRSGYNNLGGVDNIFSGYYSGYLNKSGSHNIFSGWESGSNNDSGSYNTFIGFKAGDSNIAGSYNVFIGRQAGCKETGSNRLYIDNSEYSSNTVPLIYGRFDSDQLGINTTNIPVGYTMAVGGKLVTNGLKVNGDIDVQGVIKSSVPSILGLPLNSFQLLNERGGNVGGNWVYNRLWTLRDGTTNNWFTARVHDGVSVDASFATPHVDTRTWWERDPNDNIQSWGNGGDTYLTINSGNVGIGIGVPTSKLDVRGVISTPEIAFRNTDGGDDSDPYRLRKVQGSSNNNWLELQLNDDPNESFRIYGNSCAGSGCGEYSSNLYHSFDAQGNVFHSGNVGIGTQNPDEKLAVNGTIHAKEVRIDIIGWPDYVFQKYYTGKSELKADYIMPTLAEIESFTKKNNHLPNIPSAKEMQVKGMNIGEMNNLLLQKVEELTLYAIEQNKKMMFQQEELEQLKIANENYKLLAERLSRIEKELKK